MLALRKGTIDLDFFEALILVPLVFLEAIHRGTRNGTSTKVSFILDGAKDLMSFSLSR